MPGLSTPRGRARRGLTLAPAFLALALAGCSLGTPGHNSTHGSGAQASAGEGPVIAVSTTPGAYSPLAGEGQHGNSLLYDGLLAMQSTGKNTTQKLVPALAAEMPAPSSDARTWTVKLREGVTFSDGSAFDSADVKATFEAVLEPEKAAEIRSFFTMIDRIETPDAQTVVFHLAHPYAEFDSRLLLAIAPAELVGQGTAADQALNTSPVGTGPYRLAEMTADRAVYEANPQYFGGEVKPLRVTTVYMADDNTRAQRMAAGEIDGAALPPAIAASVSTGASQMESFDASTVDFRGIALPRTAFTQSETARKAINMAVDRSGFVNTVLAGKGTPTSTPIPPSAHAANEPSAQFAYDVSGAKRLLDEAGWVPGADGVRTKDGHMAAFDVNYLATDTVRGQVAQAFAADMAAIGVKVNIEGTTWDVIEKNLPNVGYVQGGGSYPTSLDALAFAELHTRTADASSPYNNPASFGTPERDALLEQARSELDPGRRAALYRQVQQNYMEHPSAVFIAFLDHTYVRKPGSAGIENETQLVIEPHVHASMWGPWWNLGRPQ